MTGNPPEDRSADGWRTATRLVRGGLERTGFGENAEALFLTSSFVYDTAESAEARFKGEEPGYIYSRYGNPTVGMFERRLAEAEGAEACFATASGMAAVFASLMCQLRAGDRVVSSRALFGSCNFILTELLPRWGIEVAFVDGPDLDQWRDALKTPTKVVFFETPSNPTLELIDLGPVCELAHAAGARVVADNVFSTPILQRPMEYGADIVVYSGTKHIDGQGRCLGGAVLSDAKFRNETLQPLMRHTGPALSPFNAWVMLKGLETLDLRVDRQCRSSAALADFLADRTEVTRVLYPFRADHPQQALAKRQMAAGGTIVSFEVAGGKAGAFRFMNALKIVDISNNLGDAKSLVTHPATTTHRTLPEPERERLGITPGFVRLSVGLEAEEDLAEDLAQALEAATVPAEAPVRERVSITS